MSNKVTCEVRAAKVNFNGQLIDGIEVSCTECDHVEECGGTSQRSVKRALAQMRQNCPNHENNFYVSDTDD